MTVEDPVCRKTIALEDACASEQHAGWAYFFCATGCHLAFKLDPHRYANPSVPNATNAQSAASHQSRKA